MKALTICQPYAHLICLPDEDARAKRVENRKWHTAYRGPLLIHAGKSREWLELDETGLSDTFYEIPLASMAFGAIIGVADLVDCVEVKRSSVKAQVTKEDQQRWPWLAAHLHTEGPYCFVLQEVRKFAEPIVYRGTQGFFEVPPDVVQEALAATDAGEQEVRHRIIARARRVRDECEQTIRDGMYWNRHNPTETPLDLTDFRRMRDYAMDVLKRFGA